MRNKKLYIILGIILFLVIISFVYVSSQNIKFIELKKGKNIIIFNNSNIFYVKTLIELNPGIEVVSYYLNNETVGYVNVFSGVGENFIIEPNREYEIITMKDINLILPYEK